MRTSGFLLMAILLLCGCSQQDQSSEEQAGIAAKEYYDRLLAGDIDGFLKGKADMDSVPADYRSQMYAACTWWCCRHHRLQCQNRQHATDDAGIPVAQLQRLHERRDYCADGAAG